MSEEEIKKIAREEMLYTIKNKLDSSMIFTYINNLEQENKQLKEDLRVSQSNEETYCLEMQEITKILGLDEHTLFDDVKEYAKQLKEKIRKYINSSDFVYDELYKKRETIEKILGDKE